LYEHGDDQSTWQGYAPRAPKQPMRPNQSPSSPPAPLPMLRDIRPMTSIDIRILSSSFDPWSLLADLHLGHPGVGALASFVGLMRDRNDGSRVSSMTLEHYPGMTESALEDIVRAACERFDINAVRIVHRVGRVLPEDPIVLVAVTSAHRGDAFRACEYLMDYLKTEAPFWKKETTDEGERWVEDRASDVAAAARWND
jgi:molybdopterin synthase catalytic subunit